MTDTDYESERNNGYSDGNSGNGNGNREGNNHTVWNAPKTRESRGDDSQVFDKPRGGWKSSAQCYNYDEDELDEGGLPSRNLELEKALFGSETHMKTGIHFETYSEIPTKVYGDANPPAAIKSFDDVDFHPIMRENIRLAQYNKPTPVQSLSIPYLLRGTSILACAQTGSGKTAAFLIPMINACIETEMPERPDPSDRHGKVFPLICIICPTRELAGQIFDESRRFTYRTKLRPAVIYGGASSIDQKNAMRKGAEILIATCGRLKDFMEKGFIDFSKLKYLVLDEGDRMLELGFASDIDNISREMPPKERRVTAMFSATWPQKLRILARQYTQPPFPFIKIGRVGGTTQNITQRIFEVESREKKAKLLSLLRESPPTRTLIFCKTKRSADEIDCFLYDNRLPSTSIHGDRDQREREDALTAFRTGNAPILVATEVAARGLDIANVMHVVNYDMPDKIDDYIHRIGRCGRIGNLGMATSLYTDRDDGIAQDLVRVLVDSRQEIPDFLQAYVSNNIVWQDDNPEEDDKVAAGEIQMDEGNGMDTSAGVEHNEENNYNGDESGIAGTGGADDWEKPSGW